MQWMARDCLEARPGMVIAAESNRENFSSFLKIAWPLRIRAVAGVSVRHVMSRFSRYSKNF
jgi:hypothetical protein